MLLLLLPACAACVLPSVCGRATCLSTLALLLPVCLHTATATACRHTTSTTTSSTAPITPSHCTLTLPPLHIDLDTIAHSPYHLLAAPPLTPLHTPLPFPAPTTHPPAPPPALAPASSSVTPPAPAPHQSLRLPFPIYIHLVLESCLLKVLSRFAYYFRVLNLFKFPARPCAAHPPPHTTNMEPSAAVCRASRRGVCRGMCCITLWAAERRRLRISDPDAVMPTCRDGVQDPGLGSKIQSWVLRTPPWELKSRLHLRPDSPLPSSPPIPMTLPPTRCI